RGTLDLSYTAANADVLADDVLVTSGIDGTYPPGLPVAKVSRIEQDAAYSKITCVPTAGTDQNRQVLVLSRQMNLPAAPVETEPVAGKAPKPKRSRSRE
ncbi:MAG TPA: rod shape-determining protein MreC, partial [Burkholderiales bacterium]|nr:rod shape-determining protein MreC [Burkholderiales bacterium]